MERPGYRLRFCCPFVVRNAAEHVAGRRNATRLIVAHTKGGHHADAAGRADRLGSRDCQQPSPRGTRMKRPRPKGPRLVAECQSV